MSLIETIDKKAILDSVASNEVISEPFDHLIVNPFIGESDYASILKNWPSTEQFTEMKVFKDDLYSLRREFRLDEEHLLDLPVEQQSLWRGLRECLCGPDLAQALFKKFGKLIAKRVQSNTNGSLEADLRVFEDCSGYDLGPHTDVEYKLLTLLLYVPNDDSLKPFGTSMYTAKDMTKIYRHDAHHVREEFNCVKTVPFLPNTAFIFPRTDKSFHGVEHFDIERRKRKLIIYNLYLK